MPKTIFSGAHQELVSILIEMRRAAGLTQVELGRRIGKDQSVVSLMEGAQRRVDLVEFCSICRALGEDPISTFAQFVSRLPEPLQVTDEAEALLRRGDIISPSPSLSDPRSGNEQADPPPPSRAH